MGDKVDVIENKTVCTWCGRVFQNDYNEWEYCSMGCEKKHEQQLKTGVCRRAVYLVRHGDTSFYKIGKAKNASKRLSGIQSANPIEVFLVEAIIFESDVLAFNAEQKLHDRYRDYNTRGEWFNFPDGVVPSVIADLKGMGG